VFARDPDAHFVQSNRRYIETSTAQIAGADGVGGANANWPVAEQTMSLTVAANFGCRF
jgi:hypothetical protein